MTKRFWQRWPGLSLTDRKLIFILMFVIVVMASVVAYQYVTTREQNEVSKKNCNAINSVIVQSIHNTKVSITLTPSQMAQRIAFYDRALQDCNGLS